MKHLLVGLYCNGHDSNFSIYDMCTGKAFYYKWERTIGIKHYDARSFTNWMIQELPYLGFDADNILEICTASGAIQPFENNYTENRIKKIWSSFNFCIINHHQAHQYSNGIDTGIVFDFEGNDNECFSIYGHGNCNLKLRNRVMPSLGHLYTEQYIDYYPNAENYVKNGFWETLLSIPDYAGKVMAWEAYGDYLPDWHTKNKNYTLRDIDNWSDIDNMSLSHYGDDFKRRATYIKNVTLKYAKEIINLSKNFFNEEDYFSFSGGIAQNLIFNNFLKKTFPKLQIFPHNSDEGLSIGCLHYLIKKHNIDSAVSFNNFPFCQSDQDMGYASSKTIKKVAEYLAQGKIVLWCQGHGEIGPRALGHRSILMNPLIKDAKEQVNKKVKKREWYRPYGASVKFDKYKQYFNLDWESPYMLYQSEVIDKEKFKSICHADGTCRIQTVYPKQETFYNLLDEFEKLTGAPVLLNTSCNLPGKPIVGFEDQVLDMFNNCHADYLVIGDKLYERKNND